MEHQFFDRLLEMAQGYPTAVIKAGSEVVGSGFSGPFILPVPSEEPTRLPIT